MNYGSISNIRTYPARRKLKNTIQGETSHTDSLAHELIAFSNSKGGVIIIGINDKTGSLNGLTFEEIQDFKSEIGEHRHTVCFSTYYNQYGSFKCLMMK